MAIDAEDLVVAPFRELIERAQEAIANARDGADADEPEPARLMTKAASSLVKEGERAVTRLCPLIESQSQKHGDAFAEAVRDDSTIAEGRRVLEDLLYDFDDYTALDTFDAERYAQLQAASKTFARSAIETIKTMKIASGIPASPDPTQMVFPPLPPLPPMSAKAAANRPMTAYEETQLALQGGGQLLLGGGGLNVFPMPTLRPSPSIGRNSVRSSRSDLQGASGLVRSGTHMSQSSQGSQAPRRPSSRSSATHNYHHHQRNQHSGSTQFEVAEVAQRLSPTLEVLGSEVQRIKLVPSRGSSVGEQSPVVNNNNSNNNNGLHRVPTADTNGMSPVSVASGWSVPRTTAWVTEQASSADGRQYCDSILIPNGTIPGISSPNHTHSHLTIIPSRNTSESSKRASSVFDRPGSPDVSGYRNSNHSSASGCAGGAVCNGNIITGDLENHHLEQRSQSRMECLPEQSEGVQSAQQNPDPHSYDTGLMLAREDEPGSSSASASGRCASPVWYSRKANCSIGPESSLFLLGGFCRGAQAFRSDGLLSGTRPTYDYMTKRREQQCISCEYRQDATRIQNDVNRSASLNFISEGVIYRPRFLYKSHVSTNIHTTTPYGCIFCAQDGRTTREGDATVFRTKDQLFRHLARHPQPLPSVSGITVLYGPEISKHDPDVFDFDLHFPEPPVSVAMTSSLTPEQHAAKLARLPTGTGKKDHLEAFGPDKTEESILRFYAGARIIGIEFPEEYDGKWCRGWHDGRRGYFPSKLVELEPPERDEVKMPSSMNAGGSCAGAGGVTIKARWKFPAKGAADAGWLAFDKGDVISNVCWTDKDAWYWSGTTKNGKVGFFPCSHIRPESVLAATTADVTAPPQQQLSAQAVVLGSSFSSSSSKAKSIRNVPISGGGGSGSGVIDKLGIFALRRPTTTSSART